MFGLMEDSLKVSGKIIKCMEKELLSGQMVANTKVSTSMRRKKAMESSVGPTEDAIRENGETESKMAGECIVTKRVWRDRVFGLTARRLNGWTD